MSVASAALVVPLLSAGAPAGAEESGPGALQQQFERAAEEYDVPVGVLLGVSYLQSRWDAHAGAPSVSGGYGPMHLTDARKALAASAAPGHGHAEDPRGDPSRGARTAGSAAPAAAEIPARLRTLPRAAQLTGLSAAELRTAPEANLRGGAALLAQAQKRLGKPAAADPAAWFEAVASYPSGGAKPSATAFARDVFDVVRAGEERTTDTGAKVTLRPHPGLRAPSAAEGRAGGAECPSRADCEWYPAPYEEYEGDDGTRDYGNHDTSRRPSSHKIDHIVVHDTEATYEGTLKLVKDPQYVSWNYTLRSSDGHVAQHVRNRDTAWHAGNWYMNAKSVGIEHEGFLTDPDAWYTEAMYRSSARLVRYLAHRYDVPLDRQHIVGHDNVPATTTSGIPGMHTDPGPYWDWQRYFTLLGAPFEPQGSRHAGLVTIAPEYARNRPEYTGCEGSEATSEHAGSKKACPEHGSSAVRLHTRPSADAPLVNDAGLRPDGTPATKDVNDTGARATTGQQFAVAGRQGEWTAIWYLGAKAWFHNPAKHPTAVPARGRTVTPKKGAGEVPVYGVAYPEESAYPEGVPAQKLSPLPYKLSAGQKYATPGREVRGEYLWAKDFDPKAEKFQVVRGDLTYYQLQLGHRVAFVKADDVVLGRSAR
ncbi:N-acetylmuramoyl-L-alanine amidase [Streptomyces xiaopingdaonensis]|uniref:N-acetylmuramoyl-L-alanine amidase n=1 Tax=Streptomyces xiaopingdaonensis TaxID=1565415 RepID=UPI0003092C69|nr:N-acetylmuramoyl-L-alanine amidase [Streptomyces xiaopingdaonensis]